MLERSDGRSTNCDQIDSLLIKPFGSSISLDRINYRICYFRSRFSSKSSEIATRNPKINISSWVSWHVLARMRKENEGQGILSERTSLAVWGLREWRLNSKSIFHLTLADRYKCKIINDINIIWYRVALRLYTRARRWKFNI